MTISISGMVISSGIDPLPNLVHPKHSFTCHMAVLLWAVMSDGAGKAEAQRTVNKLTMAACAQCQNSEPSNVPHGSMLGSHFAEKYCAGRKSLRQGEGSYLGQLAPGDLVLIGLGKHLTHSMVAVSVTHHKIKIRGFNNQTTFALPMDKKNIYDKQTRCLSDSVFFQNAGDEFWTLSYSKFIKAIKKQIGLLQQTHGRTH